MDNQNTSQIISRFDEVLLEKGKKDCVLELRLSLASKFSISQVYEAMSTYTSQATFEEFNHSINEANRATFQKIQQVEDFIAATRKEITDDIEKSVKRTMVRLKKSLFGKWNIDELLNIYTDNKIWVNHNGNSYSLDFSGGRPINNKELDLLLKQKADVEETSNLETSKATREEFEESERRIDEVRAQLNNALVLFIECVKNNVLLFSEGKHKFINKNASLLHQLNVIYKWVNNQDGKDMGLHISSDDYNFNTVLPESSLNLFGSRRKSQNMRKFNTQSTKRANHPGKLNSRKLIRFGLWEIWGFENFEGFWVILE